MHCARMLWFSSASPGEKMHKVINISALIVVTFHKRREFESELDDVKVKSVVQIYDR